jgi:hypothetical protein
MLISGKVEVEFDLIRLSSLDTYLPIRGHGFSRCNAGRPGSDAEFTAIKILDDCICSEARLQREPGSKLVL